LPQVGLKGKTDSRQVDPSSRENFLCEKKVLAAFFRSKTISGKTILKMVLPAIVLPHE
jgi:hypothetical protein